MHVLVAAVWIAWREVSKDDNLEAEFAVKTPQSGSVAGEIWMRVYQPALLETSWG